MAIYVMKYFTGEYVALDRASGGYPYKVKDILRAEQWTDLDKIWSYIDSFKSEIDRKAYPLLVSLGAPVEQPRLPEDCKHHCNVNYEPNYQDNAKHFLDCPVMRKVLR